MSRHNNILTGARYPWPATIDGNDLVVTGVHATWFGGSDDPIDDGSTASGMSTKSNPQMMGCALPMDYGRSHHNPCAGSPIPKLPWFTSVVVTSADTGIDVHVKLIDLGPSAPPQATAAIDLTQAAFKALGGKLKAGRLNVSFRILGAAKILGVSDPEADPPSLVITPNFGPPIS